MTINLYNMTDDEKTVNKSLSDNPITYENVVLKDDTSLLKPTFIMSYSSGSFDPKNAPNYLYCNDFGRYYFIRNHTYSQQMVFLECEVDPLFSHSDFLLSHEMFIARQRIDLGVPSGKENSEPFANILLPDDFLPVQSNRDLSMIGDGSVKYNNFDDIKGLTDGTFVLLVNGG